MNKTLQHTYHLYHHQPKPLALESVNEHAWLVNNGVNYSIVATIQARTPEDAYKAVQEKMVGHGKLTRFVEIRTGNLMRETFPGDVLVEERGAWMIVADLQIQRIPYETSQPWKSYSHHSSVECVSWSPNGKHLAAIGKDVHIHNLYESEERSTSSSYRRHGNWTGYAIAWSPDGSRIASGGYDGEVHVWKPAPHAGYSNASTGSILICRTEEGESRQEKISCIAWSADSKTFIAGRNKGSVIQWNALTGECLHIFPRHKGDVNALAYAPDGIRIASASDDGTIRVWGIGQDTTQDVICQHPGKVSSFAWSPDSSLIVSSCEDEDQSLHFWNPSTGDPGEQIPLSIYSTKILGINTVAWSPDGRFIVAGCDDGTLQMINVIRRQHILTYRIGNNHRVNSIAWSPDGNCFVSGGSDGWGNDGRVRIWQVKETDGTIVKEARTS